jgi:hypothetical protein
VLCRASRVFFVLKIMAEVWVGSHGLLGETWEECESSSTHPPRFSHFSSFSANTFESLVAPFSALAPKAKPLLGDSFHSAWFRSFLATSLGPVGRTFWEGLGDFQAERNVWDKEKQSSKFSLSRWGSCIASRSQELPNLRGETFGPSRARIKNSRCRKCSTFIIHLPFSDQQLFGRKTPT